MRSSIRVYSWAVPFLFFSFSFTITSKAIAKPVPLAALFQQSKTKGKPKAASPLPEEYRVYFKAKTFLTHAGDLKAIEAIQREVLLSKLRAHSKTLEKELEDFFYALEIKKATRLTLKKSWQAGIDSYQRGLNGLAQMKWNAFWEELDSKQLSIQCQRSKPGDESCSTLAKKVLDGLPKGARETEPLRDLDFPNPVSVQNENSGDRLSQSYSEKKEKDEEDFQECLNFYLNAKDIDLSKSIKDFLVKYPKSILRFRAMFFMAESLNRTGNTKDASHYYQDIIEQIPLSFYAIVSSERLGINLRDKIKSEPILVDPDSFNLNYSEKLSLERAKNLLALHHEDEVGIELEGLQRTRNYHNDLLLYLAKFAEVSNQNLFSFREFNELIQRKFNNLLQTDLIPLIFPERYSKEIHEQANLLNVDPILVMSLMKQESGFKSSVLSSSGAIGLMQLMPTTAIETKKELVLRTLREPKVNIAVGSQYLATLLEKYHGNIPFALAAYNAGPHRVAKWRKDLKADVKMIEFIESIPFKETRDYVLAILRNRYWYQYRKGLPLQSVFDVWKSIPLE